MSIFDASPICNGAAAIVLSLEPHTSPNPTSKQVQIAGSGAATDLIHVRSRPDVLHLSAVERSAHQALEQVCREREILRGQTSRKISCIFHVEPIQRLLGIFDILTAYLIYFDRKSHLF
tara:strand:- start:457 stop:813 length:357 start_codon:yes stop_codon:yes gene_type:complete